MLSCSVGMTCQDEAQMGNLQLRERSIVLQAIHGVGIDWTFAGEAVEYGGFLVRATAVLVSLGGMLVTALMLGLVSGMRLSCMASKAAPAPACTHHSWQVK